MVEQINCPLCRNPMEKDDAYYRCTNNPEHSCLITGEYDRYESGECDFIWLYSRMKVRLGKSIHKR
jgi:hypothetical protein